MYGVRYCPDNLENILVIRKGESQVLCSGREVASSRDQSSHQPHITRGIVGLSRARSQISYIIKSVIFIGHISHIPITI